MKHNAAQIRINRAKRLVVSKRQRDNRSSRKAMGIAVIERPLRLIMKRHSFGAFAYRSALAAAQMGDGGRVRYLARLVVLAG